MRSRLHNLTKWQYVAEGDALHYPGRRQRTVVLEVNAPQETRFYALQDREQVERNPEALEDEAAGRKREAQMSGDAAEWARDYDEPGKLIQFLGVCKGRGTVEFAVEGPFDLVAEGGGAYVYSHDGVRVETVVVEPRIFTRIANRKQRNPHLEMIEFQMRLNQMRFQEQLREETDRRLKALEERKESYAPQRDQRTPPEKLIDPLRRKAGTVDDGSEPVGDGGDKPPEGGGGEAVSEYGAEAPVSEKPRRKARETT